MDPTPLSNATPQALDYGPNLPRHRRRAFQRWAIAAVLLIAIPWLLRPIESIWYSARLYYYQRQCLAHPIAPGVLVYSSGPPPFTLVSHELTDLSNECTPGVCGNPKFVPIYLGQRRASNGVTRFIALYGDVTVIPSQQARLFLRCLDRPMGLAGAGSSNQIFHLGGFVAGLSGSPKYAPEALIYSAVEAPGDASRFSFTLDLGYTHVVEDFQLQPDGSLNFKNQSFDYWNGIRSGTPTAEPGSPHVYNTGRQN